jgi:F-type H+-transporting ATPase subunit gamma
MQMVASSKLKSAQAKLPPATAFGNNSARTLKDSVPEDFSTTKHMALLVTSDRGLCGSINSGVIKEARKLMAKESGDWELVAVGQKAAASFARTDGERIKVSAIELGKKPVSFTEVAQIADQVTADHLQYEEATMLHNHFNSVISFELRHTQILSPAKFLGVGAEKLQDYDFDDDDELADSHKFAVASTLWNAAVQNQASELGARMTSMDNATRNAGDITERLTRQYNRGRQTAITTELIEIISGAAAISG